VEVRSTAVADRVHGACSLGKAWTIDGISYLNVGYPPIR